MANLVAEFFGMHLDVDGKGAPKKPRSRFAATLVTIGIACFFLLLTLNAVFFVFFEN